ncbi:MAG: hypothetical protein HS113_30350 [Verrucomicrobiales bacterium]|nr:hypothetical protein [Verrucomicrobiales bacterium]
MTFDILDPPHNACRRAAVILKHLRLEGHASGYALVTSELNGVIDSDSVVFGTLASGQPQIAVSRCGIVRVIGNYTIRRRSGARDVLGPGSL